MLEKRVVLMIYQLLWVFWQLSKQIKSESIQDFVIMGELSLDGNLQSIKGVLPIALNALKLDLRQLLFLSKILKKPQLLKEFLYTVLKIFHRLLDFLINQNL